MFSIENENVFLREEKSAIMSYLQNYTLTEIQQKEYKKLVKMLADLTNIQVKIYTLEHEKASLMNLRELYVLVGLDEKKLKEKWSKKHTEQLDQWKTYQQKKRVYEKL